jgi:small-conductance mechanosensitive channel
MYDSHQKSTGTQYTTTVAFLAAVFIFIPAMLIVSRPLGYLSVSLALACSALCASLAWVNWTKYSQLTIPSLETQRLRSK